MTPVQRVATSDGTISTYRDSAAPTPTFANRGLLLGWGAWLSLAWLGGLALAAAAARLLPLPDPLATDVALRQIPPSAQFWLGTDQIGRDILARVVFGARVSLTVAVGASLIPAVFGTLFGLLAGYFRGRLENWVTGLADVVLAFPGIVLALLVTAYAGATVLNLVLVLGFLGIPIYTRIARATTIAFAEREFVQAARALGATDLRIILRELLPNVVIPVAVVIVLGMSRIIVIEGILSFLGLSVPPPAPTWGNMIAAGVSELAFHPHISFVPAGVMFLTILALNSLSDALRKATDIRDMAL
jgi:peptide/nickel transport system permease protein